MNDDLTRRVRALEWQNRVLWLVVAAGALAVWMSCAGGAGQEQPSTGLDDAPPLRTSSLEIVGPDGAAQAVFEAGEEGAVLMLGDARGEPRAGFVVTSGGPGLALSDEEGRERLLLSASAAGTGMYLYDPAGNGRLTLGMGQTLGSGLMLVDATGMTRAGLALDEARGPSMILVGAEGDLLAALP